MNRHMPELGASRRDLLGEGGAAIVLALVMLVGLTALALALLSISALEPQISRNQADVLRARYLAESGVEHALDTLASSVGSWGAHLTGATCTVGALLAQSAFPGLSRAYGEFTVRVRNDCEAGDDRLTGVAIEAATEAARDTNGKVIVSSTGVVGTTLQTITVVVSHEQEPAISGQGGPQSRLSTYNWADR